MRVAPTTAIPDTPESILDYLVQRTSGTVGKLVKRSDAIVIGEVEETGGLSMPVRTEDVLALRPWFSGEGGTGPKIMVYQTRIRVEEWLVGLRKLNSINVVYVPRWDPSRPERLPLFQVRDRGLMFLQKMRGNVPYANYVPEDGYQLVSGEIGMRTFTAGDHQDEHWSDANLEHVIDAIRWYVALPDNATARREGLLDALCKANFPIAHHAVRELAETHASGSAERFKTTLTWVTHRQRIDLMLGLWLLGERGAALQILSEELRQGREDWLAAWGLRFSSTGPGEPKAMLFGPKPSDADSETFGSV